MAFYQAFLSQIMSPVDPHCGSGEEMAENLLLSWAVEGQRHFSDCIDIKNVFPRHTLSTWLLGFRYCWPGYLEFTEWWTVQYCIQQWHFQTFAKDWFCLL